MNVGGRWSLVNTNDSKIDGDGDGNSVDMGSNLTAFTGVRGLSSTLWGIGVT